MGSCPWVASWHRSPNGGAGPAGHSGDSVPRFPRARPTSSQLHVGPTCHLDRWPIQSLRTPGSHFSYTKWLGFYFKISTTGHISLLAILLLMFLLLPLPEFLATNTLTLIKSHTNVSLSRRPLGILEGGPVDRSLPRSRIKGISTAPGSLPGTRAPACGPCPHHL